MVLLQILNIHTLSLKDNCSRQMVNTFCHPGETFYDKMRIELFQCNDEKVFEGIKTKVLKCFHSQLYSVVLTASWCGTLSDLLVHYMKLMHF